MSTDEWYPWARRAVMGEFGGEETAPGEVSEKRVVMLLHGIRAGSYRSWVSELAGVIAPCPTLQSSVRRRTAISALSASRCRSFARHRRGGSSNWYSGAPCRHPAELISFAGHSNGTYILGRALLDVPSMRFARIYLAGSVLPRTYPWGLVFRRHQVLGPGAGRRRHGAQRPRAHRCACRRAVLDASRRGRTQVGTGGFDGFDDSVDGLVQDAGWFPGGTAHHWPAKTGRSGSAASCPEPSRYAPKAASRRTPRPRGCAI